VLIQIPNPPQQITLPFANTIFQANGNSAQLLGAKFNYNFGPLSYTANYNKSLTNIFGLKTNYFNLIYTDKKFSFQGNKFELDYSSKNNYTIKDQWGNLLSTKYVFNYKDGPTSAQMMQDYKSFTTSYQGMSIKETQGLTQSETDLNYSNKLISFSDTQYNTKGINSYSKNFLAVKYDGFNYQSAIDKGIDVNQIVYGKNSLSWGNGQSYLSSSWKDFGIRIGEANDRTDYAFSYKNIGYKNGELNYSYSPNKNLNITASSKSGLDSVNYNLKSKNLNVDFKYTNSFSVYDFYFNQNAFNVYNNNFNLIGNSNTIYKKSINLSLSSAQYSLCSDMINNLYKLSIKMNSNLTADYLRDQKQNYFGFSTKSGAGSCSTQYNIETKRFDKISIGYNFKF
jgi:hypothetical protein